MGSQCPGQGNEKSPNEPGLLGTLPRGCLVTFKLSIAHTCCRFQILPLNTFLLCAVGKL